MRAFFRNVVCSVTALSLWLAASVVVAQAPESDPERAREAAARFDEAVELYQDGSLDAALVQFERAYELVPNPRLLYNLAQVQAERHEYVAAIGLFERYLRESGPSLSAARRAEAESQIVALHARVARLWVESDVEGAQLFVDDEPAGTLPLEEPIVIDSGVRTVRVEAEGYGPAVRKLKVAGGDEPRLSLPVRALARATEQPGADLTPGQRADETPHARRLWIAGGATVALGAATLTMGLLARNESRAYDAELDRFGAKENRIADHRANLKTYAGLTDGFAVATAVALGFAVYYAIDAARDASSEPASTSASAAPWFGERAAGLGVHGRF